MKHLIFLVLCSLATVSISVAEDIDLPDDTTFSDNLDDRGRIMVEDVIPEQQSSHHASRLGSNQAWPTTSLIAPLLITGPPSERIDIIFYPGYQYEVFGAGSGYADTVDIFLQEFLDFPQVAENLHRINFYRIDEGAPEGTCWIYSQNPLCDKEVVLAHVTSLFPEWSLDGDDQIVILFNENYPVVRYARANSAWNMIFNPGFAPHVVIHEFGHSFAKLGDEYDGDFEQPLDTPPYANVASLAPGYSCVDKWGHLMHLPEVGCFQNANGINWYRSTDDMCVMRRTYKLEWCPICSETVQARFDLFVPNYLSWFTVEQDHDLVLIAWRVEEDQAIDTFRLTACAGGSARDVEFIQSAPGQFSAQDKTRFSFSDQELIYQLHYRGEPGPWQLLASDRITVEVPPLNTGIDRIYPNPFNPATTIFYTIPLPGPVTLSIYDVGGRLVKTLVDAPMSVGAQQETWHGDDQNGNRVASGTYFLCLETDQRVSTRKVVLAK
ncbi:MAG: T9SS type A sorting domain-containing protein [bacterium]